MTIVRINFPPDLSVFSTRGWFRTWGWAWSSIQQGAGRAVLHLPHRCTLGCSLRTVPSSGLREHFLWKKKSGKEFSVQLPSSPSALLGHFPAFIEKKFKNHNINQKPSGANTFFPRGKKAEHLFHFPGMKGQRESQPKAKD